MNDNNTNEIRNNRLRVRISLSLEKYAAYKGILERSKFKTMSALISHILENKSVTLEYHDATMDHILWDLADVRKKLQLIAISMNQAVIRLSQEQFSELVLAEAKVIEQQYQVLDDIMPSIFNLVTKIANIWLPK